MAITRKDVLHVAKLSRLELTEVEVDRMANDLGRILGYMDELAGVDTTGVEPTTAISVEAAPLRTDVERPGLDTAIALAEAPRRTGESFAVPAFVEDK